MDISNLWHYNLRKGKTDHPRNGACLFDAGMWLVYGKIGDNPPCSCPIIRSYAIELNDAMHDVSRQLLKPFILRIVGNLDPKSEAERLHFIVLETTRRIVPLVFNMCLHIEAYKLRLKDNATYVEIACAAHAADRAARAARYAGYAGYAGARASARYAGYAAARAADAVYTSHADAFTAARYAGYAAARASIAAHYAADYAAHSAVWQQAIWILDGALRIGKQSPEFDEIAVIQSIKQFENARN